MAADERPGVWLLLIHQLPSSPAYPRVKVSRRLRRLGALSLKGSVHLLPDTPDAREDFAWLREEILRDGGEATVCLAQWVEGCSDAELLAAFRREREQEYAEVSQAARAALAAGRAREEAPRLRRRLAEVSARDFFPGAGRADAEAAIAALAQPASSAAAAETPPAGATWVTRRDVGVDRMASAWLIRRFIDPAARFRFVAPREAVRPGELRFDMFGGEYGHDGERCTFETLLARFALRDPALRRLGELVHDVDCKDDRFGHPEAAGLAAAVRGIAAAEPDDAARLELAAPLFAAFHAAFGGRP